MKQASVKLPSGEYLIAESDIYGNTQSILFPGSWQLLGADPTALTEAEAREIVESYNDGGLFCRDYSVKSPVFGIRPTASLDSLAESLRISKPYVVLKNIEK